MIKLLRGTKPKYLTADKEQELIDKFKATGNSVWNTKSIKSALLKSSYDKCAYCECKLDEKSNYMEVDHFKHKEKYPDLVVSWDNLIPSCKRCNRSKWDNDVVVNPIINPYKDIPRDHLYVYNMRVMGVDTIGENTAKVLSLNEYPRALRPRAELVLHIDEKINNLFNTVCRYEKNLDVDELRTIRNNIHGILSECQPEKEYSYVTSATTINNRQFQTIVSKLKKLNEWDCDLELLYANCASQH